MQGQPITPPITKNLIIINVLMYFATVVGERWGMDLNETLGLHFIYAPNFHLYQLVTYMFMHANLTHIFFNMFALWMFGRTMEAAWGPRRYLIFYLLCGLGAGFMQEIAQLSTYYIEGLNHFATVSDGQTQMTMSEYLSQWTTIGASGACYGILLGFGVTYPNMRILLIIPPIPMKAKYFVIGYAVIELVSGLNSRGDNVAHFAHLGGMLIGWLIILYWRHKDGTNNSGFSTWTEYSPKKSPWYSSLLNWLKGSGRKHSDRNDFSDRQHDYEDNAHRKEQQEEIDRILDKIRRSGYESLTDEEKKKLFDARNR